ncbi:MAG: class I SAM-dependent methyltransferase [Gammaproteobacteria bacterium]|nr:class I SAM-dependent methyltransferase [Gammaproteobacteria bacterium]
MKEALKRIPGLRMAVRLLKGQSARDARDYLFDRMPKGSVCAEIGVHKGQCSRRIMGQVKPRLLHLIDPWEHKEPPYNKPVPNYCPEWCELGENGQLIMDARYEAVKKLFAREITAGRVVMHRGYSNEVVGDFDNGYFDWIYLDSNPLYDVIKQDLELYYPKVKAGGFIAGDNYAMEGWWHNEAQKAVDEFVAKGAGLTLEVREHQFMIKKPL